MQSDIVKIIYDNTVDALYLYLFPADTNITRTDSFEIIDYIPFGNINLDFNKNKEIVGIEVLFVKDLFSKKFVAYIDASCLHPGLDPVETDIVVSKDIQLKDIVSIEYDKTTESVRFQFAADDQKIERVETVVVEEDYVRSGDIKIGFNQNKEMIRMEITIASGLLSKIFLERLNREDKG